MKILVYKGKYGDIYFDASLSELSAFFALFKFIDNLNYYGKDWMSYEQWLLVEFARNGDRAAAHELLIRRRKYEYEGWRIESVIVPDKD